MKYRSKPTGCEAMKWNDGDLLDVEVNRALAIAAEEIVAWVNANGGEARYDDGAPVDGVGTRFRPVISVRTINGWAYAAPGHYVVMGSSWFGVPHDVDEPEPPDVRDFYPCDPETFDRRWEAS